MGVDQSFPQAAAKIFFPYYHEQLEKARHKKIDFVHYTSADVACSIFDHSSIWLRNARLMNDFGEIHYGRFCLDHALKMHRDSFISTISEIDDSLPHELDNALRNLLPSQISNTYLLSLSEHGNPTLDEDKHGRLSMWRAYGGDNNVAIVLRSEALLDNQASINAFGSPVLYSDENDFGDHLAKVIQNIGKEIEYLRQQDTRVVFNYLIRSLHFAILSTKHPGFAEEREWRIVYCPNIWESSFLEEFYTSVNGVPQRAFKLPLKSSKDVGLPAFQLADVVKKVIIGPNQFPEIIFQTLVEKLRKAKVPNPESLVTVSTIPLRR